MSVSAHRGVAEDDPRNQGPIAFFRPPEVTQAYVRGRFADIYHRETSAQIEVRVAQFMASLREKPPRPPPGLNQAIEDVADPWFGLGVHPDLVGLLWRLDGELPQPCRWVVWGHPALVHPQTGVIFAVAIGTIGIVARLPPELRGARSAQRDLGQHRNYDVSPAGPEWRFLPPQPDPAEGRAACQFAAAERA